MKNRHTPLASTTAVMAQSDDPWDEGSDISPLPWQGDRKVMDILTLGMWLLTLHFQELP